MSECYRQCLVIILIATTMLKNIWNGTVKDRVKNIAYSRDKCPFLLLLNWLHQIKLIIEGFIH